MRLLVWLGVGVLVAVLLALSLMRRPAGSETPPQSPSPVSVGSGVPTVANSTPPLAAAAQAAMTNLPAATNTITETKEQILARLDDYSAESHPRFLPLIVRELDHPDAEVRHAAVEALIQYGNRDAIPILRQRAELVSDPKEKAELLAAADYIALPSLTELKAANTNFPNFQK